MKTRKVHQLPTQEFPNAFLSAVMLDSNNEMVRVIVDLIRLLLRFEIKRAKGTFPTAPLVKFRIDVEHAPGRFVFQAQIRITRSLDVSGAGVWEIAHKARHRVQFLLDRRFKI